MSKEKNRELTCSVDLFKLEAKKQQVPNQKMIRALIDSYAEKVGKQEDATNNSSQA
jgi:hypothetical protein